MAEELSPENQEVGGKPVWPVELDENQQVQGLPEGVKAENVILFKGSDSKWYAQNPTKELLEDIAKWRTGWM